MMPQHLRPLVRPVADPANVVQGEQWRITLLDAGLVRLEWSPSGRFTDLASQTVFFRDAPPVDFEVRDRGAHLEIVTERLHLVYDRGPFAEHGLSVAARGGVSHYHSVWRFGQQGEGNLGGTARTLDVVDGATPLEDGVLSINGVACHDDSGTVLLTDDGWFTPREPGSLDLYVFCFGRDYPAALRALYRVTGAQPIPPRYTLGNWWSRYHRYTAEEYLALIDRFGAEGIPLSVAVVDMDWHPTDIDPVNGSGWTGYSWNRELFPDPAGFLTALHERGLRVTLNLHPADGVGTHEDAYADLAAALGRNDGEPIRFEVTDPAFWPAYFEQVLHPREAEGVDFWWVDWQSGRISGMPGLDPLWLLNHLHFLDAGRPGGPAASRPLTFSRYAGVGSHRYPVGFSGDTVVSWASLAFQPEFTATASNVGFGWWSHDIGGHLFGIKDDELATRWVQCGALSPILRLHSTHDRFNSKEPWRFGAEAREVMGRFLRWRHQLVPYLATMARRAHVEGRPVVEPMYYDHPWQADAYRVPNQYQLGTHLLAAPVTTPRDRATLAAATPVWLPDGDWVDLFTGLAYSGGRTVPMHRPLDQVPVLARAGTVLPLVPQDAVSNSTEPPADLELWVTAGGEGSFELAEDRDDDAWATTSFSYGDGTVRIGAVQGATGTVPESRRWSLVLLGFAGVDTVTLNGRELPVAPGPVRGSLRVDLGAHPTGRPLTVDLSGDLTLTNGDVVDRIFDLLDQAQADYRMKARVHDTVLALPPAEAALALQGIAAQDPTLTPALLEAVLEVLLAHG